MKGLSLGELRVAGVVSEKEFLISNAFPSFEGTMGLLVTQLSPDYLVIRVVSIFKGVLVTIEVEIYLVIKHDR